MTKAGCGLHADIPGKCADSTARTIQVRDIGDETHLVLAGRASDRRLVEGPGHNADVELVSA